MRKDTSSQTQRTTLELDVGELRRAKETLGTRTIRDTVNTALREVNRQAALRRAAELIREGNLNIVRPEDLSGLAGTAFGDLFVFGDIRDAVREGTRLATGQQADELILGLACVGGSRHCTSRIGTFCQSRRKKMAAGTMLGCEQVMQRLV